MADKIQILIEAILKKTTKQELENELRKIEKNLKPLKVNADTNAEAQIKLYKSLQKIYKEEEKQRLNQEKLSQRALADKEKLLQYEQKVRMAIEQQKRKEKELNKILQERIVIYRQEAEAKLLNLKSRYGDLLNNADIKRQIDAFRESLNNLNTSNFNVQKLNADFKTLEASVKNANAAVKATHRDVMTLGDMFKVAWNKMIIWTGAGTLLFGTIRQIRAAISYVRELDNALNEIRIVTNKTQEEVKRLALSYNKLAKEMNVTTREIAFTAADLFRQGLDDSQVEERMKAIIQYAKISSISLEESNRIITATANATGESVQKIIDIFAHLGDITASGAEEIGEALQKVASTAKNSGVSLEKIASWIATISSITRESASSIGNSLKSIISRYEQIKETGFNEEDATKINDVTKALQTVEITAVDAQGQLRPIADVLDELGSKWDELTQNEKAYVTTALANVHQHNRLITLLDNYSDSLKYYEAALNSAGTAEEKFAIYQESTQARFDKFKATLESLYQNTLTSGFMKFILDLGTGIVSLIDKIGFFNTVISGLIIYFTFFKTSSLFFPFINAATIAITKLTAGLNLSTAAAIKLNTVLGMLAPVAAFFAIQGLIKLFDSLIVTIDEQKEKVAEVKQEYESITSELNKLNEELKTTNDRINELNSKDKLTLIEENELSKLELTNEELQKRIALLEKEQEIKEEELAREAQKLYEKQFGKYEFSQQKIDEYINIGNTAIAFLDEENNVAYLIAAYKQFLDLKKEALSYGDLKGVEYFDDLLAEIEKKLINDTKELLNMKDILGSLKNPTERQKQILDEIEQRLNAINEIIISDKTNENIKKNSDSLQEYEYNFEQLNDIIDSVQSDLKTLNQVLNDVQNGQSLNAETVLDLIQKHEELIPAIHKTADGWTIEKDAIENLRKAKIEEARVAIENQIKSKEATLDNVSARVEAYGIEIDAIEDLKSAQQEASKLGFKKVFGEDAFENIKFDNSTNRIIIGDKATEWSKELYDRLKQSFNEQKLANDTILKIGELRERNKKLLELLSDPDFGVSSSKSSSSKSTPFSEQIDFINTKIKLLNQELKEIQQQLDDTFSPADKQTIIDKMIVAQQKKADLLKKAIKTYEDSAQKELQKIPESLHSAVVSGSFSIATISEKTYGKERAKEISEAIKQYQSLTDTIIGLKNEYAEIDNTIRRLNLDKITISFEVFDKKIRESNRALEELDYQLNLLKDNDYDKKAEILTKKIEVTTKQVNEYEQELERLKAIVPANAEEAEKLQERINELTKKFREGKISIKEYNDTLEETAKKLISTLLDTQKDIDKKNLENQLKEREKQIYDITEAEFEAYKKAKIKILKKQKKENEKFATEEAKELVRLLTEQIELEEGINYKDIVNFGDLYKEIHNEKIKQYQDTIDMLERSNELEQQRLEREERILEIQELQLKLQNTLNNRNVQILRKKEDGSWEYDYVADPEKVEELQKQIAKKQKDFDEWERNNSLNQTKKLLQQKIEHHRELIRISEETYNRIAKIETTKINKHYENMDILAENMLDSLKNTYSNKWDEIINVLKEKVSIAEREYAKLFGVSVAGVSGQNPNKSSKVTVQPPSTGFGTTPTAESEAYARQLKEAVGGDREAFRQAEIARTEQVIANRKAQGLDTSAQEAYLDSLLKNTFKFEKGGLVDFTGLAWVDGSKTKPEAFLNPTQTKPIGKLADSLPNMANILNNFATTKMKLPSLSKMSNNKEVKQIFNIGKLEFPNARTADEIKTAILDLPRLSLQSAKAY